MPEPTAVRVAREYWRLMGTNQFGAVATVLAEDFILEWPQSMERIRGPERFVQMNIEYPSRGPWQFAVQRIVGDEREAVSDVIVSDGHQTARAISFFTVTDGAIVRLVEFWPEPYQAPPNRGHLTERLE